MKDLYVTVKQKLQPIPWGKLAQLSSQSFYLLLILSIILMVYLYSKVLHNQNFES